MSQKILCVDDEPNILEGYKRALRKDFDLYSAEGGVAGLAAITANGPFAVIVSDMRMPGLDGVQFLTKVKEVAPDSVRMMLTGNADQQTAMSAVNKGSIFRFLTKPCPPETLAQALAAGLEQYRLVTAEKQLLEETLNNSLQVLVEILALVNATAFSRATRVKRLARDIAQRLRCPNAWEVEIAAMLSQIGCITVPEETLQKIVKGEPLTGKELRIYQQHPQVGRDLIARIPRLETVANIIGHQNRRISDDTGASARTDQTDAATIGARILKVVLDFDKLLEARNLPHTIYHELASRVGWYDPVVLNALFEVIEDGIDEYASVIVPLAALEPGMLLDEPLTTTRGAFLLSAGHEITFSLILRLQNFFAAGLINEEIHVRVHIGKEHAQWGQNEIGAVWYQYA